MSGHTPGPWEAHQRPAAPAEYGHYVTTSDGLTVCNVTYQLPALADGKVVEATRIANARLIASAPELLEALQEAWAKPTITEGADWWGRVAAVLTKATGATP